jgi:hypothetical protein
MNNKFLKDYLEERVTRNAVNEIISRTLTSQKKNHTKSSELRSKSVARQIFFKDIESQLEDMKMKKGSENSYSFIDIENNKKKLLKNLVLPPINKNLNNGVS